MAALNTTNLLLSLAVALADAIFARHGVAVPVGEVLFVHNLPASASNLPGAVLRIFGGPPEGELRPVPVVSVQCMTFAPGSDGGAGLDLANLIYDALHTSGGGDSGGPRQTWAIAAKTLDAVSGDVIDDVAMPGGWDIRLIVLTSGPPGVIGREDATSGGRWQISFNFDVRFTAP